MGERSTKHWQRKVRPKSRFGVMEGKGDAEVVGRGLCPYFCGVTSSGSGCDVENDKVRVSAAGKNSALTG
jgi:hypothetical protein